MADFVSATLLLNETVVCQIDLLGLFPTCAPTTLGFLLCPRPPLEGGEMLHVGDSVAPAVGVRAAKRPSGGEECALEGTREPSGIGHFQEWGF